LLFSLSISFPFFFHLSAETPLFLVFSDGRFLYNVLSLDSAGSFIGSGWHAQNGMVLGWKLLCSPRSFSAIRFDSTTIWKVLDTAIGHAALAA
jgi:hypothetical protein